MDKLEDVLKQGIINEEQLNQHSFNKVTEMHNDNEVYCNTKYTIVIRQSCHPTIGYDVNTYWLNQEH